MNPDEGPAHSVLDRTEAAQRGLSRFYTHKPCKSGHLAERYVSNRQCVACNAARARDRERSRSRADPSFRMFRNTLRRTGMALKGAESPSRALGCDQSRLRDHIQARFSDGMSWERYRHWEVDHLTPLSAARSIAELVRLCHYTNLQPLWRRENRAKGGA